MTPELPPEAAARAVMQAHFDALNARDEAALAATLHFPHYRLTDGALKTWDTPDTYFADFRKRASGAWRRSALGPVTVVHETPDKVHLDVTVLRYGDGDTLIAQFQSLWVIARLNGRWAAQLRSSLAPDAAIIAANNGG